MSIGTVLLYALAVVVGLAVLFFGGCFVFGALRWIEETVRSLFGLRPRNEISAGADKWIWQDGKAIRKRTVEDQLEIIRKRNAFKESMTDREKAAYEMGVDDGWEDGMEEGRLIGYRRGSHK